MHRARALTLALVAALLVAGRESVQPTWKREG
jgi:hypothetical protein